VSHLVCWRLRNFLWQCGGIVPRLTITWSPLNHGLRLDCEQPFFFLNVCSQAHSQCARNIAALISKRKNQWQIIWWQNVPESLIIKTMNVTAKRYHQANSLIAKIDGELAWRIACCGTPTPKSPNKASNASGPSKNVASRNRRQCQGMFGKNWFNASATFALNGDISATFAIFGAHVTSLSCFQTPASLNQSFQPLKRCVLLYFVDPFVTRCPSQLL
jgi:hypothetical protein